MTEQRSNEKTKKQSREKKGMLRETKEKAIHTNNAEGAGMSYIGRVGFKTEFTNAGGLVANSKNLI